MIVKVNDANLQTAAEIHAKSWRDSHAAFCSESFITQHTAERQKAFLEKEMQNGKQIYMLIKDIPVGIVSIQDSLIENLYILPSEQHKGYGTELLRFAINECAGKSHLWVLNNNMEGQMLYRKQGFCETGKIHQLSSKLFELEMEFLGGKSNKLLFVKHSKSDSF